MIPHFIGILVVYKFSLGRKNTRNYKRLIPQHPSNLCYRDVFSRKNCSENSDFSSKVNEFIFSLNQSGHCCGLVSEAAQLGTFKKY